MLSQYLDYQRETLLSKTDGLTRQQLAQQHPPSQLTLAGLLHHLSLVEEDWMEVRFAGLPDREPWASVDCDCHPSAADRAAVRALVAMANLLVRSTRNRLLESTRRGKDEADAGWVRRTTASSSTALCVRPRIIARIDAGAAVRSDDSNPSQAGLVRTARE
jgi:hypothetical protein